ncbi:MAG: hypothetical protein MHPSP_001174 [Paramarteilia canceri]
MSVSISTASYDAQIYQNNAMKKRHVRDKEKHLPQEKEMYNSNLQFSKPIFKKFSKQYTIEFPKSNTNITTENYKKAFEKSVEKISNKYNVQMKIDPISELSTSLSFTLSAHNESRCTNVFQKIKLLSATHLVERRFEIKKLNRMILIGPSVKKIDQFSDSKNLFSVEIMDNLSNSSQNCNITSQNLLDTEIIFFVGDEMSINKTIEELKNKIINLEGKVLCFDYLIKKEQQDILDSSLNEIIYENTNCIVEKCTKCIENSTDNEVLLKIFGLENNLSTAVLSTMKMVLSYECLKESITPGSGQYVSDNLTSLPSLKNFPELSYSIDSCGQNIVFKAQYQKSTKTLREEHANLLISLTKDWYFSKNVIVCCKKSNIIANHSVLTFYSNDSTADISDEVDKLINDIDSSAITLFSLTREQYFNLQDGTIVDSLFGDLVGISHVKPNYDFKANKYFVNVVCNKDVNDMTIKKSLEKISSTIKNFSTVTVNCSEEQFKFLRWKDQTSPDKTKLRLDKLLNLKIERAIAELSKNQIKCKGERKSVTAMVIEVEKYLNSIVKLSKSYSRVIGSKIIGKNANRKNELQNKFDVIISNSEASESAQKISNIIFIGVAIQCHSCIKYIEEYIIGIDYEFPNSLIGQICSKKGLIVNGLRAKYNIGIRISDSLEKKENSHINLTGDAEKCKDCLEEIKFFATNSHISYITISAELVNFVSPRQYTWTKIQNILKKMKISLSIDGETHKIALQGPTEKAPHAEEVINNWINFLKTAFKKEFSIQSQYVGAIIGTHKKNIAKMESDYNVQIYIKNTPSETINIGTSTFVIFSSDETKLDDAITAIGNRLTFYEQKDSENNASLKSNSEKQND